MTRVARSVITPMIALDADLQADRELRGIVDVERDGPAAGGGEQRLALDEQALGDQLGGDEGDGGGAEADGGRDSAARLIGPLRRN